MCAVTFGTDSGERGKKGNLQQMKTSQTIYTPSRQDSKGKPPESQLRADDTSVLLIPVIVTDSPPLAAHPHLHPALAGAVSNEAHR